MNPGLTISLACGVMLFSSLLFCGVALGFDQLRIQHPQQQFR